MKRSPSAADDTQPHPPSAHDTQPTSYILRRPWWGQRGRWLLLSVIVITFCTLALTLVLFMRALPARQVPNIEKTIQVSINYGGQVKTVSTAATTVGDLIAEQGIALTDEIAISPAVSGQLRAGMVISIDNAREVTIMDDGERHIAITMLDNPLAILQEAGIVISSADKVWVNGALADPEALPAWTVPAMRIEIRRAATLTISDDGELSTIESNAETVGDALFDAGITLYFTDEVTPPLDTLISGNMTVNIKRAIPVKLMVDGVMIEARTNASRVGEVLVELNAPLFGLDYVLPPADSPVSADMSIEIVRVTEEVVTERETINFERRFQADAELPLDQRRQIQAGKAGAREIRSRVRYENGIELSRELSETVEVEAPLDEIIAYGAKIVYGTVQTPQGPRSYWRRLCVFTTSYNPTSNGGNTRTSTGATLDNGIIAAKPHIIAYQTQVYVSNYGFGIIADTGAGPSSTPYWIDLGYNDNDWISWRGYSYVYLLGSPPSDVNYLLPAWAPTRSLPGNCN